MKRLAVVVLGAFAASLLVLAPGGNVGAEHPDGLVVNPDEGVPGDVIATQVDPEAVEDACITTLEELVEAMNPDEGEGAIAQYSALVPEDLTAVEQQAVDEFLLILGFLADPNDLLGFGQLFVDELPYLLSFVDIATQEPVGEMSEFDPETGQGSIAVPELDPGLWVVAALCVEPQPDADSVGESIAAGVAFLESLEEPFSLLVHAEGLVEAMVTPVMGPRHMWTSPFTIPVPRPVPSPENEAFCAVLPELQPLGAAIMEALANLPEDDGEMDQQAWEDLADWDAIGAELEELFAAAQELLDEGDENRPDAVAPQWDIVTQGLRDARDALEAVDYDLSTESGRAIAGQLREGASADDANGDADPAGEAATGVLTQWFIDNCIPAAPPEVPVEETPRAVPAPPAQAQPTFTG